MGKNDLEVIPPKSQNKESVLGKKNAQNDDAQDDEHKIYILQRLRKLVRGLFSHTLHTTLETMEVMFLTRGVGLQCSAITRANSHSLQCHHFDFDLQSSHDQYDINEQKKNQAIVQALAEKESDESCSARLHINVKIWKKVSKLRKFVKTNICLLRSHHHQLFTAAQIVQTALQIANPFMFLCVSRLGHQPKGTDLLWGLQNEKECKE